MGFTRQEYWSGLPCPPLGNLSDPEIELMSFMSPALARGLFTTSATWESHIKTKQVLIIFPVPLCSLLPSSLAFCHLHYQCWRDSLFCTFVSREHLCVSKSVVLMLLFWHLNPEIMWGDDSLLLTETMNMQRFQTSYSGLYLSRRVCCTELTGPQSSANEPSSLQSWVKPRASLFRFPQGAQLKELTSSGLWAAEI